MTLVHVLTFHITHHAASHCWQERFENLFVKDLHTFLNHLSHNTFITILYYGVTIWQVIKAGIETGEI